MLENDVSDDIRLYIDPWKKDHLNDMPQTTRTKRPAYTFKLFYGLVLATAKSIA